MHRELVESDCPGMKLYAKQTGAHRSVCVLEPQEPTCQYAIGDQYFDLLQVGAMHSTGACSKEMLRVVAADNATSATTHANFFGSAPLFTSYLMC